LFFSDAVEFAKRTPWQIPLLRNLHIFAVITEQEKVCKVLRHLVEIGRSPPGLDQSFL
jgi:hypothetical protein